MAPEQFGADVDVMRHALAIAASGEGHVEPNPQVGAVIVTPEHRWIADGYHQQCGGPHAEIHAIRNAGERCRNNDLFVTLEPCSHHGRTPPCVDAVIEAGFRRVIIGCSDPAPHVNGSGIDRLRRAGLQVEVGVCREAAERLIAPFRMLHVQQRPWVHAKWAMTLDGRIATRTGHSRWISNAHSRRLVHGIRGRMDVILTGSGTVRSDNPLLTARPPGPRTAIRAVMDSTGESLTPDTQLVRTAGEAPVLVFVTNHCAPQQQEFLQQHRVEVCVVDADATGRPIPSAVLKRLAQQDCTNLLLEAGPGITGAFLDAGLIDEVHAFVAPKLVGGSTASGPVGGRGVADVPQLPNLTNVSTRVLEGDVLIQGDIRREEATELRMPDL
jgi:diaminohydroxyphosphoribosylaminopyrimidine deaminase/5-amino-6-(5-phosphoribosylamino)uracil reductase